MWLYVPHKRGRRNKKDKARERIKIKREVVEAQVSQAGKRKSQQIEQGMRRMTDGKGIKQER